MSRPHNFGAGPGTLPLAVLEQARDGLVDTWGRGVSVLEASHRSRDWQAVQDEAEATLRRLLGLGDEHAVLFLQGGASLQFAMVPMNLFGCERRADYLLTGTWSEKARNEAGRLGSVRIAASTAEEGYRRLPEPAEIALDEAADYAHVTSNNTIVGTQWRQLPETGEVPLVVDMSSDVLSRPLEMTRIGLFYAGAQKNLGPAGVTLVVVRRDLLERAPESLPAILRYRTHAAKGSLYNTPPMFAIWLLALVAAWVEGEGGVGEMARRAEERAGLLYRRIDRGDFYLGTVEPAARSLMNVTFRLADQSLEKRFLEQAAASGLLGLAGHRSVGGVRASLYNAMSLDGVAALVDFMDEFERAAG